MIVCALSGGVDSATAAALLVEAGHQVVGITMRLYNAAGTSASVGGRCCGPRDIEDARRVCDHLGIPFYVLDLEAAFAGAVIEDFARAYLAGETPNPCVRCNQRIKFTPLLARARALGAEVVATGHYARLEPAADRVRLLRGADTGKDQSYFLFSMPASELASVRFPLGAMTKETVRAEADRLGLPNAAKPDSQEICFVPDGDTGGAVERIAGGLGLSIPVAGDIVDGAGNVLGRHRGVHRYTLGQRRGLGDVSVDGRPVYVVAIDAEKNRIVVGPRAGAGARRFEVGDVRWFVEPPEAPLETTVQVRHRATPIAARVLPGRDTCVVEITGDRAPVAAPGQAAVFYRGDEVLGGGWIRPRPVESA